MTSWIIPVVVGLAALLIGCFAGYRYNKSIMESKMSVKDYIAHADKDLKCTGFKRLELGA